MPAPNVWPARRCHGVHHKPGPHNVWLSVWLSTTWPTAKDRLAKSGRHSSDQHIRARGSGRIRTSVGCAGRLTVSAAGSASVRIRPSSQVRTHALVHDDPKPWARIRSVGRQFGGQASRSNGRLPPDDEGLPGPLLLLWCMSREGPNYDVAVLGSERSQVVGIASQDDRTAETNGGGDDGGVHSVA